MNMKLTTLSRAAFAVVAGFAKQPQQSLTRCLPMVAVYPKSGHHRSGGQYPAAGVFCRGVSDGALQHAGSANLGVDTFLPKGGTVLNIPQQLILPDTVHEAGHYHQ